MKTRLTFSAPLLRFAVILLAAAAFAATPTKDTPSPAIQRKIDGLLKGRLKPEPLPINPPNPFQLTAGLRRDSAPIEDVVARAPAAESGQPDDRPKEPAGPSDLDVLVNCAQKLRLGGVFALKDQIQLVVNGTPRKEGDVIAADWNNTIVQLRVVRLTLSPNQLVLSYKTATVTVPFSGG